MALTKKYCQLIFIFAVLSIGLKYSLADQISAERIAESPSISRAVIEDQAQLENKWYSGVFYDYGDVVQGSKPGKWTEGNVWLGRKQGNFNLYAAFSHLRRLSEIDYTSNLGFYLKLKDYYLHEEIGFGFDVNFIYKFQNIVELSHKLYKNLFWQVGYTYRDYNTNDSHLVYPGLTYYLGDNYFRADYGISHIVSRGTGQFGTLKGSFAIIKCLRWDVGTSVGQWLYDIYGLSAEKEFGYILFTMFNFQLNKDLRLSLGYSYGTEKPSFIKRSINASLLVNF